MTVRAAWLLPGGPGAPGQTREDTRLAPVGTYAPDSELGTRSGVVPGGSPFAAVGAGAMAVQIGVGRAVVQGTAAQGAYPVAVTAPETLTIPDGNALHPRIDSVVLRVYDGLYDTSGETLAVVERLQGEPAALPQAPTLPVGCLRLWDVTVAAGASAGVGGINWSSALADRRAYTVAVGGIRPGGSASTPGAYDGQYRDNGAVLERWNAASGAWQTYYAPVETAPWITASLASGYSHNGNNLGTVRYRRIILGGIPHMEWRGGMSWTTSGTPPNSGNVLAAALSATYRPAGLKSVPVSAGGVPIKCDFQSGGVVRLIASSGSGVTTWASLDGVLYPLDA